MAAPHSLPARIAKLEAEAAALSKAGRTGSFSHVSALEDAKRLRRDYAAKPNRWGPESCARCGYDKPQCSCLGGFAA